MKIPVFELGQETLTKKEKIPASLWEIDSFDVTFVDDIEIETRFTKVGKEIILDVQTTLSMDIVCSRCLGKVRKRMIRNFQNSYNLEKIDESFDINEDIREDILINFPMKVLCKDDCKGLCSSCGIDLNSKQCRCKKESNKDFTTFDSIFQDQGGI